MRRRRRTAPESRRLLDHAVAQIYQVIWWDTCGEGKRMSFESRARVSSDACSWPFIVRLIYRTATRVT